nr:PQQ-binding-like beta-propeller repeat protein [Candidatus Sigynarchaeum springense]
MDEECEEGTHPGKWGALERAARASRGRFPIRRFSRGVTGPTALAFSPDNKHVVSSGYGGLSLHSIEVGGGERGYWWDGRLAGEYRPEKEGRTRSFPEYMDYIMSSVAFSPDGRRVYAGDGNGAVYCWDVATGQLVWRVEPAAAHGKSKVEPGMGVMLRGSTGAVAVSPDGKTVASGGSGGHVKAWNAGTGELVADVELALVKLPPGFAWDTYWLRGRRPAVTDAVVYENLEYYSPVEFQLLFGVASLAFSPDGRWIACGMAAPNDVTDPVLAVSTRDWSAHAIMDFGPRKMKDRLDPKRVEDVYYAALQLDFSPDGRWLVAACSEGARLFEVDPAKDEPSWKGGGIIGYDQDAADLKTYDVIETWGARFLGKSGRIAVLNRCDSWALMLGLDAREAFAGAGAGIGMGPGARAGAGGKAGTVGAGGAPGPGDVPGLVFATMTNPRPDLRQDDGRFAYALAASPDGRRVAVGDHGDFVVIDLADALGQLR